MNRYNVLYMKYITLEILTAPHCRYCEELLHFWDSIKEEWFNVKMKEIDIVSQEGQELVQKHMIFASPGIIINGELFGTGRFDGNALQEKLRILSAT